MPLLVIEVLLIEFLFFRFSVPLLAVRLSFLTIESNHPLILVTLLLLLVLLLDVGLFGDEERIGLDERLVVAMPRALLLDRAGDAGRAGDDVRPLLVVGAAVVAPPLRADLPAEMCVREKWPALLRGDVPPPWRRVRFVLRMRW